MPKFIDLTGKIFGKWTVLNVYCKASRNRKKLRGTFWNCKCECGNVKPVYRGDLISGGSKSCIKCKAMHLRASDGVSAFNMVLRNYKRAAAERKLVWNLTNEDAFRLFKNSCIYCGKNDSSKLVSYAGSPFTYNGIDRVDNEIGYEKSNCVSCCELCNWMKRDLSIQDFLAHISRIWGYTPEKQVSA